MENSNSGDTAPNKNLNGNSDPSADNDNSSLGETIPTRNLSAALDQGTGTANDGETAPIRNPSFIDGAREETLQEGAADPVSEPAPVVDINEPGVVIGDTAPVKIQSSWSEKKSKLRRWPWVLLGLFLLVAGAVAGAYFGYQDGIRIRLSRQASQIAIAAKTQFDLGNKDLADGNYESARKRFEYVAQIAPGFPGITQKLTQVMVVLTHTDVPTAAPTLTLVITPTPDNRGVEDLIKQAQDSLRKQDWDGTITTLDNIRKVDPTYRAVDVDGMYYIALRFRGIDKILKNGNLEGGVYDMAQAESFAPIDHDADSYRTWATLYLQGAAYWGVDWPKVIDNFSNIIQSLPGLRDGSNMTATERYRVALLRYGDQLAAGGDWCGAEKQYNAAQQVNEVPGVKSTLANAKNQCATPTPKITKTKKPTSTESAPEQPTDTPAPVEKPTKTPQPAEKPTETPQPASPAQGINKIQSPEVTPMPALP
jgi:tetratricopeptide (TPR) repeat protein